MLAKDHIHQPTMGMILLIKRPNPAIWKSPWQHSAAKLNVHGKLDQCLSGCMFIFAWVQFVPSMGWAAGSKAGRRKGEGQVVQTQCHPRRVPASLQARVSLALRSRPPLSPNSSPLYEPPSSPRHSRGQHPAGCPTGTSLPAEHQQRNIEPK
eukprot:scaffold146932_cov39-Prasinocladus_malaysianus.AAC.2